MLTMILFNLLERSFRVTNGFVSLLQFTRAVTIIRRKKFKDMKGIWHNSYISLDDLSLNNEIMNLKNSASLSFHAAHTADKIIHGLRSIFLSWSNFQNGICSLIMLASPSCPGYTFIPSHCDKTCL